MPREIKEIKREIDNKVKALDENPELQNDEKFIADLKSLNTELDAAKVADESRKALMRNSEDGEKEELKNFSMRKTILELSEGRQVSGLEREVIEEGVREARELGLAVSGSGVYIPAAALRAAAGQNVTTPADGGYLTEESFGGYIEALRDALILTSAGARFMTGLHGKISFPTETTISGSWEGEGEAPSTTKVAFSKKTMSPKRLSFKAAYTRELLVQSAYDIERLIIDNIVASHSRKLQEAALVGNGQSGVPTGIIATSGIGNVAMGTNGGPVTWAKIVELETKVAKENAKQGNLAYVTNSKVIGDMKTIERTSTNGRYLLENGSTNGYKVLESNVVPSNLTKGTATACSALIFGNFADLYIGQWGGLELQVDPYALADSAQVVVRLHAFHDVLVAREKSFAAILDLTTNA